MLDITKYEYEKTDSFYESLSDLEASRLIDKRFVERLETPFHFRVAVYIRVSTPSQTLKYSIPEQIRRAKELIDRKDWELVCFYGDPGVSGKVKEVRGGFNEMVEHGLGQKFDLIITLIEDRFGRNFVEMVNIMDELYRKKVQVLSLDDPGEVEDPRLIRDDSPIPFTLLQLFKHWQAQEESKKLSFRFNLGKQGKARKGKIPVKTPYGIKKEVTFENNDPTKRKERDLIVPEKAIVVRKIFNYYDNKSYGMKKIAEKLNFEGIPSPTGKKWCYSTIKYILHNPTYIGAVRWGWRLSKSKESRARFKKGHEGIVVKGKHEAIISKEQFMRVQKKMKKRSKLGGRATSSKGLLVGIAKCGLCGGGTYVTKYPHWYAYTKSKNDRDKYKETHAYLCSSYSRRGRSGCERRYVMSQQKLENMVIDEIRKLADSDDARETFVNEMQKNKADEIQANIDALQAELETITQVEARQKKAYEHGVTDLQTYQKDIEENRARRLKIQEEIQKSSSNLEGEQSIANKNREAILALADFDKNWERATFEQRKELMTSILSKVVVFKRSVKMEFLTPNN